MTRDTDIFEVTINPLELEALLKELSQIKGLQTKVIDESKSKNTSEEEIQETEEIPFQTLEEQTEEVLGDIIDYDLSHSDSKTKRKNKCKVNVKPKAPKVEPYVEENEHQDDFNFDDDVETDHNYEDVIVKTEDTNTKEENFDAEEFLNDALKHEQEYFIQDVDNQDDYHDQDDTFDDVEPFQNDNEEPVKIEEKFDPIFFQPETCLNVSPLKDDRIVKIILHKLDMVFVEQYFQSKRNRARLLQALCDIQCRKEKYASTISEPMPIEDQGWVCHICFKLLINEDSCRRHIKDYHYRKGNFKCDRCGYVAHTNNQLMVMLQMKRLNF